MFPRTSYHVESVVIGAGVVGLAVARALAKAGREVVILEQAQWPGSGNSSRNSEVVHGGLYYPTGSWKHRLCVRGKELLYQYCRERNILSQQCGKLVLAPQDPEDPRFKSLFQNAQRNGVEVHMLSESEVQTMEPSVLAPNGALWSPTTGLVDSHGLMESLLVDAEIHGALLVLQANLEDARIDLNSSESRFQLKVDGEWMSSDIVVNSGGLWSHIVAQMMHQQHKKWNPPSQYFCKGSYFKLKGTNRKPFCHLVYPMPDSRGGLGVHATIDLGGNVKFGPDVEWLDSSMSPDEIDWTPSEERQELFYSSIRSYWPDLEDDSLIPDYAGVRPKLTHPMHFDPEGKGASSPFRDFQILAHEEHGFAGLIHCLGIESPGLTSSMAIGEVIAGRLAHQ